MNRDVQNLRQVIIKLTQMIAQQGVKVTQQGMNAFVETDPRTLKPKRVNIPMLPDNATDELIMAIQGFIDHECGHILNTDFKMQQEAVKLDKASGRFNKKAPQQPGPISTLWNILEDAFIERKMREKFPGTEYNLDQLYKFFIGHMTQPYVDKAKAAGDDNMLRKVLMIPMVRAWAGQRAFQDYMAPYWPLMQPLVDKLDPKLIAKVAKIKNSRETLELAIDFDKAWNAPPPKASGEGEGEGDGEGGEPENDEGKEQQPGGASGKEDKKDPSKEGKGASKEKDDEQSDDPAGDDAGEEMEDEKAGEGDEEPAGGEDKADGQGDDEGEVEPGEGKGSAESSDGAADDGDEDEGSEGSGDADGDDEGDGDEDGAGGSGEGGDDPSEGSASPSDDDEKQTKAGHGAADWFEEIVCQGARSVDFDEGLAEEIAREAAGEAKNSGEYIPYTRDFDKIEPFAVAEGSYKDQWLAQMDDKTRHMVGVMQKDIERMMAAESRVLNVPGFRSGRLHAASLHRLASKDDRVFRRKQEHHSKDVIVSLLVDNSGSMGGAKMALAMDAAYALSQTLERVGIKHEVLGFTTDDEGMPGVTKAVVEAEEAKMGRRFNRFEPLYIPIYKGMDERLTSNVKKRFAAATHQYFLANNVDGESLELAAWRLLGRRAARRVVIVLSDGFPASIPYDPVTLNRHLSETVERCEQLGVETIGIGIMSDAVKQFYPKHVILHKIEELPAQVMQQLKGILLAA